jgi:hypothetical protein
MAQTSYLLRFWRTSDSNDWRVTLVSVTADAEEQHFTTVEELLIYLRRSYPSSVALPDWEGKKRLSD